MGLGGLGGRVCVGGGICVHFSIYCYSAVIDTHSPPHQKNSPYNNRGGVRNTILTSPPPHSNSLKTTGAVFVPMYEQQRLKECEYILSDSGAKLLLVSKERIYDKVIRRNCVCAWRVCGWCVCGWMVGQALARV